MVRKNFLLLFLFFSIFIISLILSLNLKKIFEEDSEWRLGNFIFKFRASIEESRKIEVVPSCKAVFKSFNNPLINSITLYFPNSTKDFPYFAVETFELANKLSLYYKILGREVEIKAVQWNFTYEPIATPLSPGIYLIGPSLSNETKIELNESLLKIKANSLEDFDKAVVKTFICIFNITS